MNSIDSEQLVEQAKWIKLPDNITAEGKAWARFRGTVRLDRVPLGAILSLAVDGYYRLYINGIAFGSKVSVAAGETAYPAHYDLSGVLKRGVNVLGIEVASECASARVCAQMRINTRSGELLFFSDKSWLCTLDSSYSQTESDGVICEVFNESGKTGDWLSARLRTKDWSSCVEDDDKPVSLKSCPLPALVNTTVFPVYAQAFNAPERAKDADIHQSMELAGGHEIALLKAGSAVGLDMIADPVEKKVIKTPRGDRGVVVVIDYDYIVKGRFGLTFASGGSGTADVFFAMSQPEDEGVPVADSSLGMMRINFQKGEFDIRSLVSRQFRFVRIEFRRCTKPVELSTVDIETSSIPAEVSSEFECNHTSLTEKWGDYVKRSTALLGNIIEYGSGSLNIDTAIFGAISRAADDLYADSSFACFMLDSIEQWSRDVLELPTILLTYFEITGDNAPLLASYQAVADKIQELWNSRNDDGLLVTDGKVQTMPNIELCRALGLMSMAAWICGKEDDAYRYREDTVELRKSILRQLYDKTNGLLCAGLDGWKKVREYPVDVNLKALQAEILDQYERNRVYHWLARSAVGADLTPAQTFTLVDRMLIDKKLFQTLDIVNAVLNSKKNTDGQYDILACYGLVTVVNGVLGVNKVLGVPGRYSISPQRMGLKVVNASVVVREGRIGIGWRYTRNGLMISVEIPENARVDLYVGSDFGSIVKIGNRTLANSFVSLSSGSHRIHCYENQGRKLKSDKSLLPETPWTKVEVLEGVSQFGVRQRSGRNDRRRHKADEPEVNTGEDNVQEATEVQQEQPSDRRRRRGKKPEQEPQVIDLSLEAGDESPAEPEEIVQNTEEAAVESRSKRRRRSRSRRKPADELEENRVVDTEQVSPESSTTEMEAVEQPEHPEEEVAVAAESRSKRRRRNRSRKKSLAAADSSITEEPQAEPVEEVQTVEPDNEDGVQVEVPVQVQPKRRRHSRIRRKPVEPVAEAVIDVVSAVVDAPVSEVVETVDDTQEPAKPRRRSRPRRRHTDVNTKAVIDVVSASSAVAEEAPVPEPIPVPEPQAVAQAEMPADDSVEHAPKQNRSNRRRRPPRRKPQDSQEQPDTVAEIVQEQLPDIGAVEQTATVQESDAAPKPRRRRYGNRKPKTAVENQEPANTELVAENTASGDSAIAPEEKPKSPRRRRRPAKSELESQKADLSGDVE